jgi:hypothetical protein
MSMMKKGQLMFSVVSLVLLIAAFTNPDPDQHKEAVKAKFNAYIQRAAREGLGKAGNEWEQAGQAIGLMLGGALLGQLVDNLIATDNYVLFSVTKISWEGESKIIGVGAFGNVFLSKQVDEVIQHIEENE